MRGHIYKLSIALLTLSAQAQFHLPSWVDNPGAENAEFAWWIGFSDPFTNWQLPEPGEAVTPIPQGEGNLPTEPKADNDDAVLIQNGSASALIAGSGGIYDNSGDLSEYLIYDAPALKANTLLLQLRSIGSHAEVDSAQLFFREEEGGLLQEAVTPVGGGFLVDGTDTYTAWEWDLSAYTIFDYYLTFTSSDSSMSLQEVQLDTTDKISQELGFPLTLETNSAFATVGEIEHSLAGQSDPQLSYQIGDTIELVPVANSSYGHTFVGWLENITGSAVPASLTFNQGSVVRAVFAPTSYTFWGYNNINYYIDDYNARLDANADPDFNGLTNLLEYALGGEPEAAMDERPVRPQVSVEGDHLLVTFRRQTAASDIAYTVKVSSDLENWDSGESHVEELAQSISLNSDGTETVTYRDLTPIPAGGARFITVEITTL